MTEAFIGKLILARHHESEWNKSGQWTGIRDRHLTEHGFEQSTAMGALIRDIPVSRAFASMKVRAIETLSCILEALGEYRIPTIHSDALNERDYGVYTGKNKWEMQKLIGDEAWTRIRRNWDEPIKGGESLKDVFARVVPFYKESILPLLRAGHNVLVVGHGNSLRALVKYIERISDDAIAGVEIPFGAMMVYAVDTEGHSLSKVVRKLS